MDVFITISEDYVHSLQDEIERLRDWLQVIANGEHVHAKYPEAWPDRGPSDSHPGPCEIGCPVWAAKKALEGE